MEVKVIFNHVTCVHVLYTSGQKVKDRSRRLLESLNAEFEDDSAVSLVTSDASETILKQCIEITEHKRMSPVTS